MVRYLKRLKSSKFVRVKAFPMYGGIGVSAPSLHRESTDSLIVTDFMPLNRRGSTLRRLCIIDLKLCTRNTFIYIV